MIPIRLDRRSICTRSIAKCFAITVAIIPKASIVNMSSNITNANHQQAAKKLICVHLSANELKSNIPSSHPLEKCSACKAGRKYASYDNAASHLRRTHFWERQSQPNENTAATVAFGKDDLSFSPIKELENWIKEVWVDGEEESDAIMETKGSGREDTADGSRRY